MIQLPRNYTKRQKETMVKRDSLAVVIVTVLLIKPPKKAKGKKKKKGAAKAKAPTIIDGIPAEEMTKEQVRNTNVFPKRSYNFSLQLEAHIGRLREELDREREERNYFQLERDKVNTFWEISKQQLEEGRSELRNKDREMEEMEERHQVEIKVKQKSAEI